MTGLKFRKNPMVFIQIWLVFGLLTYVVSLVWAAYSNRCYLADGPFWFYEMFKSGMPFCCPGIYRSADMVLQIPALSVLHLMPTTAPEYILRIAQFTYSIHPILSLVACWYILRRSEHKDFIVWPIISLALATESTHAFSVGVAADSLSLFWPTLFLITIGRRPLIAATLSVTIAFTYEPSFILFVPLAMALKYKWKAFRSYSRFFLSLSLLFGISWCLYRTLGTTLSMKSQFFESLERADDSYRLFTYSIVACLFTHIFTNYSWVARGTFFYLLFWFSNEAAQEGFPIWPTFDARTTALPVGCVLAIFFLAFETFDFYGSRMRTKMPFVWIVACLGIFAASIHSFQTTSDWNLGQVELKKYLAAKPGCSVMPRQLFLQKFQPHGIADWAMPYLAVLISGKRVVENMVFVAPEENQFKDYTNCRSFLKVENPINEFDFSLSSESRGNFDFSIITRSVFENSGPQ